MSGGFITSNCLGCGKPYRDVTWEKFKSLPLIVSCPKCKKRMIPSMTKREGNYAYECGDCELYIWVSDILPDWKDLK